MAQNTSAFGKAYLSWGRMRMKNQNVRTQGRTCYSEPREVAHRLSKTGTLSTPGNAIFALLRRPVPPRPSCAIGLFPPTLDRKLAAASAKNAACRPVTTAEPKNHLPAPLRTEKPPLTHKEKDQTQVPSFCKKEIRSGVTRDCHKPTRDQKSNRFAQEDHSAGGEWVLARTSTNSNWDL